MNRNRFTVAVWIVGLLAWSLSGNLFAGTGRQQLDRFLDGLTTMSAEFVQTVSNANTGEVLGAEGSLYLQRPGRFRWEYLNPRQVIVADGKRVWLYDKELDQISHRSQESALEGTPALLLTNDQPLENSFHVLDAGHRDGFDWVKLQPKLEDGEFSEIQVGFSGDQMQRMDIVDGFGQVTQFRFLRMRRNPELDAALFRFKPPSGIDMISE